VLLIKQYSIETIIGMFERLRRQEHDASEVTFIFKLFIKLHKLGLPGD
jgi:2-iminoacetate synthase ThiH